MNNKRQENKGLYIATGILDVIGSVLLICLLVVFLIFYMYIDSLMVVPGMSSFAGLVYGSLGYAAIAVVVLIVTIPLGVVDIILECILIEKRQKVKKDNMTWLLIVNGIITAVTLLFIFFLMILWLVLVF